MKAFLVLMSMVPLMTFAKYPVSHEDAVRKSKTISSLLQGIEADYPVKCEVLVITKDRSSDIFKAKTSCYGKDAYGDDYAVIVDIAGTATEHFATVATINMQIIP